MSLDTSWVTEETITAMFILLAVCWFYICFMHPYIKYWNEKCKEKKAI